MFTVKFRSPRALILTTLLIVMIALVFPLMSSSTPSLAQTSPTNTPTFVPKGLTPGAVQRVKIALGNQYLIVEALNNDLVHFELSALGPGPDPSLPIYSSPMVANTSYSGPSSWSDTTAGNIRTLATADTSVAVNTTTLCATVTDTVRSLKLSTYCPLNLSQAWKGLSMTPETFTNGYGLGAEYISPGSADGDWIATTGHQQRDSQGSAYGDARIGWNGGATGNIQYPVLYALGSGSNNYAMFLDNYYKQQWNFNTNPWTVQMWGDWIRWYVMTGADLPTLRKSYMDLVGHPLVPPKKMFGLWVSTYGYHNWNDINTRLTSLINNNFPVDGFVTDLYWFGGVGNNNFDPTSMMGNLNWVSGQTCCDFPNPASQIASYKTNNGVGIISIEESYVAQQRPEYTDMTNRGYLVGCSSSPCTPTIMNTESDGSTYNGYFGTIGMIDWTNPQGAAYWHNLKRQPNLINNGVIGHWLDLNEPEILNPNDWYFGFDSHIGLNPAGLHSEADVHNMFAFFHIQGVYNGYQSNNDTQRPFMMSRSGAPGIQRYGATNWSNDIASNFSSLATWSNVQMQMVMSGMDYYSSDLGGFQREACGTCDYNQLYTQWFATGMMFDVPGRPHSDNISFETTPSLIGKVEGNRANTQRRYELSPYTYSLAYRAYLNGEPVVPPLVYYYQTDPNVRTMGNEKMLGHDLLAGIVASQGEYNRGIYLPAGDWVGYDGNEWFHSTGQWFNGIPEYRGYNIFRLPLFARAGAIIPNQYVDSQTGNALGFRRDGTTHKELITKVYASPTATNFTLYEDDGQTTAYTTGAYQTTLISQVKNSSTSETVTIAPTSGTYTGAPTSRDNQITLVVENQTATGVTFNGNALQQYTSLASYNAASSGWINTGYNVIQAKSGSQNVSTTKTFVFTLTSAAAQASVNFACPNVSTVPGQSVFVVGSIPALGNWSVGSAVKLDPSLYPTWTGVISNLPVNTTISWKCIKRDNSDNNNLVWGPDPNNSITTVASGFSGTSVGIGGF